MNMVIILIIILAMLFALTFFTKRRFGVLGLALAAGAVLSNFWATDLTPMVRQMGLETISPPLTSVVAAALVLLPALVLLFSGPSYTHMVERVIGSAAFALLALAFLLPTLGSALTLYGDSLKIYTFISDHRVWLVTLGLLFAIFDLLAVKTRRHREK